MRTLFSLALIASALTVLGGCASSSQMPSPGGKSQGSPSPQSSSKSGTQKSSDTSSDSQKSSGTPAGSSAPSTPATASTPSMPTPSSGSAGAPAGSTRTAGTAGSAQTGPAQTPEERRAVIDRRLEGSLGTFDETLRKEQKTVAEEKDARDAASAGSASTEQTDPAAEGEGDADAGSAKTETPSAETAEGRKKGDAPARPGDLRSDKDRGVGNGSAAGSGSGAGNIPDGSDDDIVARRLRKAAEQETDPELKDKLWKEYVEYKKNAGQ